MPTITLKDTNENILYTTDTKSYLEAIKEASDKNINIENLCIDTNDCDENLLWEDYCDLRGLNLSGLHLIDDRFREKSDNTFIDVNLKNADISISDVEDGDVSYISCNLCGANLSSGFTTTISDCIIDENTVLPYPCGCDSYDVDGCAFVFNNGKKMNLDEFVVCFTGVRDEELKEHLESIGITVANSMTKSVNVVVAKDVNSTSSKVKKAKELGLQLIEYKKFKTIFNLD